MNKQQATIMSRILKFLILAIFMLPSLEAVGSDRNWNIVSADIDGNNRDDLIFNFGSLGVWAWMNNTSWRQLHSLSPKAISSCNLDVNGQADLIFDFAPYGIWILMNNQSWLKLHDAASNYMVTTDLDANGICDVVIGFNNNGIWIWKNNQTWLQLHQQSAKGISVGHMDNNALSDVTINFGDGGVWAWMNSSTWLRIGAGYTGTNNALGLTNVKNTTGIDYLFLNGLFTGVDLYNYSYSYPFPFRHVIDLSPTLTKTADIDGNGVDDIIFSFGNNGTWVYMNSLTWFKLHSLPAGDVAAADLDGNGMQDLVVDFLQYGVWLYMNNNSWVQFHPASPTLLNSYPYGSGVTPHEDIYPNPISNATIAFTSVPAYGAFDNLKGIISNLNPANYRVIVFIKVGSGWWVKPFFEYPLTKIASDGTWTANITTGGDDNYATEVAAFLVPAPPANFTPPTGPLYVLPSALNAYPKVWVKRN